MSNIQSLTEKIQEEIIDNSTPLTALFLKVNYLALQLKNQTFSEWVQSENIGYENYDSVPQYRRIRAAFVGDFMSNRGLFKNVPVSLSALPNEAQERTVYVHIMDGIASLESMSKEGTSYAMTGDFVNFWNLHSRSPFSSQVLMSVERPIDASSICQILHTIRSRLQQFIMELSDTPWIFTNPRQNTSELERIVQLYILQSGATMSTFNQQGQQVQSQNNAGNNMVVSGTFTFGDMKTSAQLVKAMQEYKRQLSQIDADTDDADFAVSSAIQEAKKTEPNTSAIVKHLETAKSLVTGMALGAGFIDGADKLLEAARHLASNL